MHGDIRDWNKEKNKLTWDLFKQGYAKDNHPDYVKWVDYMYEFEYTPKFLYDSVWEAPCGIVRKGKFTYGYMSYAGVDWRVENNNYNFHCPYMKKDCELFHPLLRNLNNVGKCTWQLSNRPYDYNNSAEKIEDERQSLIRQNLKKKFGQSDIINCACCRINQDTCEPYFKYEAADCVNYGRYGCRNDTCWITKEKRDTTLANIYYDVKTTEEFRHGFIVEPVIKITKGKKLFDYRKVVASLEMYLKAYPDAPLEREQSRHSSQLFFSKYHGKKFELEVLNVRIEKRESRDLLQDLQDIKDGIQVIHESDMIKKVKEDKRERKQKYQEDKAKRAEKKKLKEKKIETDNQISMF